MTQAIDALIVRLSKLYFGLKTESLDCTRKPKFFRTLNNHIELVLLRALSEIR